MLVTYIYIFLNSVQSFQTGEEQAGKIYDANHDRKLVSEKKENNLKHLF